MATIKEEAKNYVSQRTKNITELDKVPTDLEITEEEHDKEDGTKFTIKVVEFNGERYRVPVSVLNSLKAILEDTPDLKYFKVKSQGTGMNTEYIVIPIINA